MCVRNSPSKRLELNSRGRAQKKIMAENGSPEEGTPLGKSQNKRISMWVEAYVFF